MKPLLALLLFVLTSACDFPSGDPALRGRKGSVYEGGHKVPLIAWWPGRIAPGSESNAPAITLDIMPTMLALAGVASPRDAPLDGVDLSPVLFQQHPLEERPLFWASLSNDGARSGRSAMATGSSSSIIRGPSPAASTMSDWNSIGLIEIPPSKSTSPKMSPSEPAQCGIG